MFSGDESTLLQLLSEIKEFGRWDEAKIALFRAEMKETLRKPASKAKIVNAFDSAFKFETQISLDDIVDAITKLSSLNFVESIALAYNLLFSHLKPISSSAKKFIVSKLSDFRISVQIAEIPEEIRTGLLAAIQADEEFLSMDSIQQVMSILRDNSLSAPSGFLQPGSGFGMGLGSDVSLTRMVEQRSRFIAAALEELGPKCSANADSFRKVLISTSIRIDEEQIALILVTLLPGDKRPEWNYEVVTEVLQQECKSINWVLVVKRLDNPRLTIRSEADFQVLVQLIVRISGSSIPPAGLLHSMWSNVRAQFTLLALLSGAPRTIIDFSPFISQDQIIIGDNIPVPPNFCWVCHAFYARLLDIANNGMAIEVLEVIMKAASNFPEYVLTSLAVVQQPGVVRLEVLQRLLPLFTGLPGSKPSSHVVMRKLFTTNTDLLFRLCYIAFKKATKAAEIIMTESIVKNLGAQYFRRLETDSSLEDLIGYWCVKSDRQEFSLEEKLTASIDTKNVRFLFTFVKYHGENLRPRAISQQTDGIMSVDSFTTIVRALQQFPAVVSNEEIKSLVTLFNAYQQQNTQFQQQSSAAFPTSREETGLEGRPTGPDSEEVEALANAYFQKIYTTDISIQEVIQLLRQFKTSSEKKEQELFRCMVHNLFDEYRFFHKYPEKELQITARLFGSLIQHQLISSITLGIALRYVLEALRKDPDLGEGNDKMFRFGQIALEHFKSRLGEWPQYCSHLIQIPHLSRHNAELFQEAQRALSNPQPAAQNASTQPSGLAQSYDGAQPNAFGNYPNVSSGATSAASAASASAAPFMNNTANVNSLASQLAGVSLSAGDAKQTPSGLAFNVSASEFTPSNLSAVEASAARETEKDRMVKVNLPVEEAMVPSDSVRDTVHFIINNVAKNNIEAKSQELKELMKPEFYGWFANYLVEKRVSSQPNLHPLYLTMLDIIDSPELCKLIVDSTLHNVTKFLSSSNITSSTSERSILRHFGIWLGQMTLTKNKPLLQRKINLKQLIIWGYETGHLIAVCPFVAKVVEGVKDSKVFRPPNPWLMAILGILRELSEVEDLKLNIKFEVQVLCKNINVKLEDIPKSNILQSCRMPIKDQKNPDFNFKPSAQSQASAASIPNPAPPAQSSVAVASEAKPVPVVNATGESSGDASDTLALALNQAVNNIVINASLTYFASNPTQRRVVGVAVERGIREIYPSAVDRSVALATTTTKQLILKDFSTEGSESSLQKAAHTMVSSLAGSLSFAICKEPLRISIGNHLRTLLTGAISDQALIEQIVSTCANDNIELGSVLIEKAAVEKSIREIDVLLAEAYQSRKRSREMNASFVDESVPTLPPRFPAEIQDILRPSSNGLSSSQLQLYETFSKLSNLFVVPTPGDAKPAANVPSLSMSQAIEAYQLIYGRLDQALRGVQLQSQGREITLAMLGDHEITQLIKDLVLVTQRTVANVRNETAMTFSESIFNKLFESTSPSPLRLEVFVTILEAVREACGGAKAFNPDMFAWLGKYSSSVSDEFSRRLYRHILLLLIRAKLIKPHDLDSYLVMQMEGGANIFWLELALVFIKQSVTESLCSVYDFAQCIESIQQMRPTNVNVRKSLQKWILDMKNLATTIEDRRAASAGVGAAAVGAAAAPVAPAPPNAKEVALKQQIAALLEKWLAIWSNINDQLFSQYLQLLHQFGVFRTEESADKFFRLALEVCVEASLKSSTQEAGGVMNYMFMDGLSKLFTLLIRVADKDPASDPLAPRASVALLNRMLVVVAKLIIEDHDSKKTSKGIFDQRPYYRILSNMSQDLGVPTDERQEMAASLLPLVAAHAQCYLLLQPSAVPGFAYSWLLLISKRTFMPYLVRNQKGWQTMHKLLGCLLTFLQPYLKLGVTLECVKRLYKGMLRILLVLLHDFPEFLCDFHLSLCEMIPLNCVQLRNLVLSAFPRTMRLPDPFTPNLRLDALPESLQAPRILVDYQSSLGPLRGALDNFVSSQQPSDFLPSLATTVSASLATSSSLCTAVVLYLATLSLPPHSKNVGLDFLKTLIHAVEGEQRYIVLNIVANQLRYPNSHTNYFSSAILALFADTDSEAVQEQITRVLFERLIAHRPHPWGLLITFIELIKNPKYAFWRKPFTRSNPDIEKVFESMARSCLGPNAGAVIKQGQGLYIGVEHLRKQCDDDRLSDLRVGAISQAILILVESRKTMVLVTVKWNKSSYQVDLAPELGVGAFKAQLFSLTNVPPERQKLMGKGAWAGILKDDADLTTCNINDSLVVTLMGTADVIVSKPAGEVKFVEDMSAEERAKAGTELPSGLINLGNTCYMNATVQCLRFVDGFKSLLSVHPLATQLQQLFDELDRSSAPVLPYRFLQTLRTFYPQFNEMKQGRHMQQDADEFFGALMSAITQNGMTPEFMRAIGLRMEETLTCTESAEEPIVKRDDVVYKLVCNINGGAGASVVIDHLADGIKLGLEGTLEKRSDILQRDSLWTKKQRIASLPSVLCVQFMRFFWRATPESRESAGSKCKILRAISFTETLDVFDFCSEELQGELRNARHRAREADQTGTDSQTAAASSSASGLPPTFTGIYELCGVVTHQGRSADSGHYMSYVRSSKTNSWIKFNDDKVSEATIDEILHLNGGGDRDMAYFCFYRMRL